MKQKILIVDGHSMIFQWPELSKNYATEGASVRDSLVRMLTALQDNSDWTVAVVFDGRGIKASSEGDPGGIKIFYSRDGQTADSIIERLAAKYAVNCDVTVATDDHLERTTVEAFGAMSISSRQLQSEIEAAEQEVRVTIQRLCKK
ncbi:MAG: NYN domain-containing protein [Verrucomicrobia bacterium]|nr:NYN domain-containing protein [Verrucomicrobiota bacterium]